MRILFWVAAAIRCLSSVFGRVEASVSLRAKGGPPSPTGPARPAALADREAQALVHGDRLDELDLHLDVVTGHDHLDALGQLGDARHVGGPEVELRAVAREERRGAG